MVYENQFSRKTYFYTIRPCAVVARGEPELEEARRLQPRRQQHHHQDELERAVAVTAIDDTAQWKMLASRNL